ncbi:MAG: hypothetical protein ABIO60_07265 [Aquaticitalea sp.]
MTLHTNNGPEKDSKDKPVTQPIPRTNADKEKADPRKNDKKSKGENLKVVEGKSTNAN